MADKIVKIYGDARFLPRHDTLENWQTKNPILLEAEPSYVIDGEDGKKIKFGDGVTLWNDLPYLSSNINNGGDITIDQTYSPTSENAQSGKAVAEAISEALMDYGYNFSEIKGLNVIRVERGENGTHTSILKYISGIGADERILIFDNEIVIEVSDSIEYLNSIGFEVDSTYQIKISNGELEYIGKLKKGAPTIVDQTYTPTSENAQSGKAVAEAVSDKQDSLVSGTNIKTINNQSILGSGNITIEGGSDVEVDQNYNPESENAQSGIAVAEALRTLDKKYELIETITLTEAVQQISRTSEPDGKAYNFKKLAIDYRSTELMSRVRVQGNYKFGNSTFPYNCYIAVSHTMGYIEVDARDVIKYYGAGGAGSVYTTQWCTTGAFATIQKADTITSLIIEGTNFLYAGTVINIYGVR